MSSRNGFVHNHGSRIQAVRACSVEDGIDLLAVAGAHTLEVLSCVSFAGTLFLRPE